MKYRVVECQYEEVARPAIGPVVRGPIENTLLLLVPNEKVPYLQEDYQGIIEATRAALKTAGFEGELLVASEDLRFARFEPVEEGEDAS